LTAFVLATKAVRHVAVGASPDLPVIE
jgi:hypothetical protein